MSLLREQYLAAMGIQVWKDSSSVTAFPPSSHGLSHPLESSHPRENGDLAIWQNLENQINTCTLCDLHRTRKNAVFGVGNKNADLLIIGEAPGATEDAQGKPFVGRAGMLLDEMLKAINLQRDEVFIANILKCRPPNNRDPLRHEVELCTPYLQKQIELIKPKIIMAVGRIAAHFLLNTDVSLGRLRNKIYSYGEHKIPLIVTYHPAYLLRSPREKAKAYEDLFKVQELISRD